MRTIAIILALAGAVAAQNVTLIPSNITSSCSSFLTTLNNDTTLSTCVQPLINTTSSFSPTSGANLSSSDINSTLASLCKTSAGCSDATIRSWLSQFYGACTTELTSSTAYNVQVRELYDILYVVNPLKGALCAIDSANQDYCVNEIIAAEKNASTSASASSSATSASASASASSSSAANSTVLLANLAATDAWSPVAVAANNLYISISSSASSLTKRLLSLSPRQSQTQSTFATIITPNSTTYRSTNLPFLFLQPTFASSQLCLPCTREVMVAYIKWESAVPYALGLSASPILGGQLDLWSAISTTCGSAFTNAITAEVGVLASASNATSAAESAIYGAGTGAAATAVVGVAVVAGAMALFASLSLDLPALLPRSNTSRVLALVLLLTLLALYIFVPRLSGTRITAPDAEPYLRFGKGKGKFESHPSTADSDERGGAPSRQGNGDRDDDDDVHIDPDSAAHALAPAMAAPALKHLKISPKEAHQSTVIFLHGLGDSGHGWLPVAKSLWPRFPNTKWILPHAPALPVTINGGMRMPAWFDLAHLDNLTDSRYDDEPGLLASVRAVDALVQAELDAGVPEDKIVVGGFSQGGAVACLTALTTRRRLAGVVCLSTWVVLGHKVEEMVVPQAKDLPIFWGHGKDDPVVQYQYGVRSVDLLTKKLGFHLVPPGKVFARPGLRFESYPGMGHSSSTEEITHLEAWLEEALK